MKKFSISFLIAFPTLVFDCFVTCKALSTCHSCFAGCQNISRCDCANETCQGDYCYVRFYQINGLGAVRKGCVNAAPSRYVDTCQFAANNVIECYCRGDRCNNADRFRNYHVDPLPLVSCCECEGYSDDDGIDNDTIPCLTRSCIRNCTGNYCFNDIVRMSQGCGWGYSLTWQFLRNTHRVDVPRPENSTDIMPIPFSKNGGDMTCVEAFSDFKTMIRACSCAYDFCNRDDTAMYFVKNDTEARESGQSYCYAVHAWSNQSITADVYLDSTTCPGHFCFVTYTAFYISVETENGNSTLSGGSNLSARGSSLPKLESHYELTAGCMLIDEDAKVETGCTIEWSQDVRHPTKKHCVCGSHMCNYFNLITNGDKSSLLAFDWKMSKDYKSIFPSSGPRIAKCPYAIPLILLLIAYQELIS